LDNVLEEEEAGESGNVTKKNTTLILLPGINNSN